MANYEPTCDACRKCMTCRGNGTIKEAQSGERPDGSYATWYEIVTCRTCGGRGGHACGKH